MPMASSSSASSGRALPADKTSQNQEQLKCPRCDSWNTKFCYYNNYSLSQPRHFCKACKRYWTHGGTLRNVPVGGGCRKNKRVAKRPSASSTAVSAATALEPPLPVSAGARSLIDISTTRSTANVVNPVFYDVGGTSYPSLHPTVDLPQRLLSGVGLGFSSVGHNHTQDMVSLAPILSGRISSDGIQSISSGMIPTILGATDMAPTIASLLASTIQHKKFFGTDLKEVPSPGGTKGFSSFEVSQDSGYAENELRLKEGKAEGLNTSDWTFGYQNQMHLPNPSPNYWNVPNNLGAWHDPANSTPSVPSLI